MKIYLAGAINGLTYPEATRWRKVVTEYLDNCEIVDPMRGKEFLNWGMERPINDSMLTEITSNEVFNRDISDIDKSEIVLVNLGHLNDQRMIGTLFELGYAYANNKFIIGFSCPNKYRNHPFLKTAVTLLENINDACDYVCAFIINQYL
jgi:nucleoside 2-deoxyribosyltransferase